jgi:hypothetical protein
VGKFRKKQKAPSTFVTGARSARLPARNRMTCHGPYGPLCSVCNVCVASALYVGSWQLAVGSWQFERSNVPRPAESNASLYLPYAFLQPRPYRYPASKVRAIDTVQAVVTVQPERGLSWDIQDGNDGGGVTYPAPQSSWQFGRSNVPRPAESNASLYPLCRTGFATPPVPLPGLESEGDRHGSSSGDGAAGTWIVMGHTRR